MIPELDKHEASTSAEERQIQDVADAQEWIAEHSDRDAFTPDETDRILNWIRLHGGNDAAMTGHNLELATRELVKDGLLKLRSSASPPANYVPGGIQQLGSTDTVVLNHEVEPLPDNVKDDPTLTSHARKLRDERLKRAAVASRIAAQRGVDLTSDERHSLIQERGAAFNAEHRGDWLPTEGNWRNVLKCGVELGFIPDATWPLSPPQLEVCFQLLKKRGLIAGEGQAPKPFAGIDVKKLDFGELKAIERQRQIVAGKNLEKGWSS